jgi:hypothetical protein
MSRPQGVVCDDGQGPPPIVGFVYTAAQNSQNKHATFCIFVHESKLPDCLTSEGRKKLLGPFKNLNAVFEKYPKVKRKIESVYFATAADESATPLATNTISQLVKGGRSAWNMGDPASEVYQTLNEVHQPPPDIPLSDKLGGARTMETRAGYQLEIVYNTYGWEARNMVLAAALAKVGADLDKDMSPPAAAAGPGAMRMWVHETGFPNLKASHVEQAREELGYMKKKEKDLENGEHLHPGNTMWMLLLHTTNADGANSCNNLISCAAGCPTVSLQASSVHMP